MKSTIMNKRIACSRMNSLLLALELPICNGKKPKLETLLIISHMYLLKKYEVPFFFFFFFFLQEMNFMENKTRSASYDSSFRRNVFEICQKCSLHFPDVEEFKKFSEEISQPAFLKSETTLDEIEREIIRTFYLNNEKVFLVCYQL